MKLSPLEENGLRCLLQIARANPGCSMTISEISQSVGISTPNIAKLMRLLRKAGFIESERGQTGGYKLKRAPEDIVINDVLTVLGGRFFKNDFCMKHAGNNLVCIQDSHCTIRSLWSAVQHVVDDVLNKITLADLLTGDINVKTRQYYSTTASHTSQQDGDLRLFA